MVIIRARHHLSPWHQQTLVSENVDSWKSPLDCSFVGRCNHGRQESDYESSASLGSSVLGTEDELAVSLRFMNFGTSPPSSDEDSGLSSFVENPQYFCGIIKDKDMCGCRRRLQRSDVWLLLMVVCVFIIQVCSTSRGKTSC